MSITEIAPKKMGTSIDKLPERLRMAGLDDEEEEDPMIAKLNELSSKFDGGDKSVKPHLVQHIKDMNAAGHDMRYEYRQYGIKRGSGV